MKRILILTVGILASFTIPANAIDEPTCFEDMSCWNCETMGNRICGLTATENATELLESRTYNGTELPRTN